CHATIDPRRRLLDGSLYPPVHDVQLMVDGAAAEAMGSYVRQRWARAAYEEIPAARPAPAPIWPDQVQPDFTDVSVALARTEPGFAGAAPVTEVERLYARMIRAAKHVIYIENQYLTSELVAASLTQALKAHPGLEAIIV